MKIDNTVLQAGALVAIGALAAVAACRGEWGIVSAAITGLFAVLSIHPKPPADAPPAPPADGPQSFP